MLTLKKYNKTWKKNLSFLWEPMAEKCKFSYGYYKLNTCIVLQILEIINNDQSVMIYMNTLKNWIHHLWINLKALGLSFDLISRH